MTIETKALGDSARRAASASPARAQAQASPSDRTVKLERLRMLLDRRGVESLALTSRESLAWLLDGARVSVPMGGDPVLSAVIGRHDATLHVYENERDRLVAEELGDLEGWHVRSVPWFERLPAPAALAEASVVAELRALRAPLLPQETARYRALGTDAAAAVTRVLSVARPGDAERDVAARLAHELVALGAEPAVLLVAGAERLGLRHPLPTDAPLGRRAMVVVGARRAGLMANLTRWIGDEPRSADEPGSADVAARLLEVEADAFEATLPGRALADVLADIAGSYARHGFAPDEWRRHHQGGPTGYAGRDPRATPMATDVVVDGQAFAWNPTAPRQKVEDTVLIGTALIGTVPNGTVSIDSGGVEVLTSDPGWPGVRVRGVLRPASLPYG